MVRSDQDQLIYESDERALPPVSQVNGDSITREDYEESFHDRSVPLPKYHHSIRALSISGLIIGLVTTIIGGIQVFILPLLCPDGPGHISFSYEYYYGFTFWCGIMMMLTATTGIRSTISMRKSTVDRYCVLHVTSAVLCTAGLIIMCTALALLPLNSKSGCTISGYVLGAATLVIGMGLHIAVFFILGKLFIERIIAVAMCCFRAARTKCCPPEAYGSRTTQEPLTVN